MSLNTYRRTLRTIAPLLLASLLEPVLSAQQSSDWPMFGQSPSNTASSSSDLSTRDVSQLKVKWTFTTTGDVSARAAVVDGVAYFPDWGGSLWAVNANAGKKIWSHQLSDYGVPSGTVARTSPAVSNGILYIGTQYVAPANATSPQPPTGWLLAVDARTGRLLWKLQPETSNAIPVITGSPVVAAGIVYVGMTSNEEGAAASSTYACCSTRGSIVAISAFRPVVLWKRYTVPTGYSGGAVWGSTPVADEENRTLYIGTGNNYSTPTDAAYIACIKAGGVEASCLSADDHADSIVALDMFTGNIRWTKRLMDWNQTGIANGSDSWNVDCIFVAPGTANCPAAAGPDYDFGSGPNLITYKTDRGYKTILGAGQKSGIYYAFDPETGSLLWQTQVGPGSSLGGMEWGSATDGQRIYVAIANFYGIPYSAGSAGSWAALDPATGKIIWQKADPNGAIDIAPMAASNGVVYAASMGGSTGMNTMFALDAATGNTLWRYAAGSSVNAGAVIAGNTVYWGSGYSHLGIPGYTGNTTFYAFSK